MDRRTHAKLCFTATSTAPQIGRKRRFSSTEPDDDEPSTSAPKRHRLDPTEAEQNDPSSSRREEGEGVGEVTKGVQEVEIGKEMDSSIIDPKSSEVPAVAAAAAIPLPESPVLEAQKEAADEEVKDVPVEDAGAEKVEAEEKVDEDSALVDEVHVEKSEEGKEGAGSALVSEDAPAPTSDVASSTPENQEDATTSFEEVVQKDVSPKKITDNDAATSAQDH